MADQGSGRIDIFKLLTLPTITIGRVVSHSPTSSTLNAEVDPASGGKVIGCHFEYGIEAGNYSFGALPCLDSADAEVGTPTSPIETPTEVHADIAGLTTLTTYHFRLEASNAEGTNTGQDETFTALPNLPSIDLSSAPETTPTTATLEAHINPGLGPTIYRFQYGKTAAYGTNTPISESVGSDNTDHPVTVRITGLSSDTIYHFRADATNFAGTTHGLDQTFTTPGLPDIAATTASQVTSTTATLAAQITPELSPTTYHFQYGSALSYGLNTSESPSIGADRVAHGVSIVLTGLSPATIYHFRAIATNSFGATAGPDEIFTTAAAPFVASAPPKSCKAGSVRRHGVCAKKHQFQPQHHRHGGGK